VIHSASRGVRVVAPAGSGKTETLVRRAARRIESKEVEPTRMLVLSFDNSAKRSFEQKFRRIAPKLILPRIETINAFGLGLLKRHFREELGKIKEDDEIRKTYERKFAYLEVLHWDGKHRKITDLFDALKYQGYSARTSESQKAREWLRRHYLQLPDPGESFSVADLWSLNDELTPVEQHSSDLMAIFEAYQEHDGEMRQQGLMDYTDQKLRPLVKLREDRESRDTVQACFDEIVVDECQDVNRLDALLIYVVTGSNTSLVVAGDDDQSLYEFREANSLYLREPERHFGRPFETIHLNLNYRTPMEILTPAVRLIEHNFQRLDKDSHSGVSHQGHVDVIVNSSPPELGQEIINRVASLIGSASAAGDRILPDDIAILCPNGDIVKRMRNALKRASIEWAEVPTSASGQQQRPGVIVDTLRKAKGRQWRVVILTESNDSLIPGPDALRVGDIESQRRTFYVAMTRPSERLIVGYCRRDNLDVVHRTADGEIVGTNGASRFLFEAGIVAEPELASASQMEQAKTEALVSETPETMVSSGAPPWTMPTKDNEPIRQSPPISPKSSTPDRVPLNSTTADYARHVPSPQDAETRMVMSVPAPPIKQKRAVHLWELRQAERDVLDRARANLESDDQIAALFSVWRVVIQVVKRITKDESRSTLFDLLPIALDKGFVNPYWFARLDTWRRLRVKYQYDKLEFDPSDQHLVEEMVYRSPELFAHVQEAMRPVQTVLFADDQRLFGIQRLSEFIQTQQPHPLTQRPVRALRFDPVVDGRDMLVLQLHLLIKDVRFFIPEDYRWTTSPLLGQLSVEELSYCHPSIRGSSRNKLQPNSSSVAEALLLVLKDIVANERRDAPGSDWFAGVLEDARLSQNGNYPSGLKLNPKK